MCRTTFCRLSPHKNYADDLVLPRMEDGNGFGAGRKPPGGYVVRMDKDGKNCELFASGQRNTYDIAFNADGELFGFDSDMEWDWGSPWYRPTRAYHIVSGGDQGFREGSAKYPTDYQDSLPEVVNIGIGSPTGVLAPTKAKFPPKFQRSLLMMDWSYGRIVAVHFKPDGASYKGTFDTLVKGKPLNVTDMEVGPDGALYFATGGRGTQSGLYRVSYVGPQIEEQFPIDLKAAAARELRHQLESFHGKQDPSAIATAWPHLKSDDRFIRYAARIAIESQPVSEWKSKALEETNPNAALTALLALARLGGTTAQADVLSALAKFPTASLSEDQQLLKLRVIEVSVARQGRPADEFVQRGIEKLSPLYPAKSWPLNRELSQTLIYLDAPGVVTTTLNLVAKAATQEEQLHYIVALRKAKTWTLDEHKRYLSWFQNRSAGQDAGPDVSGRRQLLHQRHRQTFGGVRAVVHRCRHQARQRFQLQQFHRQPAGANRQRPARKRAGAIARTDLQGGACLARRPKSPISRRARQVNGQRSDRACGGGTQAGAGTQIRARVDHGRLRGRVKWPVPRA